MFASTPVRLHHNVCQFSFASKSICFLFLVCAYIKMFAFTPVCLHQNVFQFSLASKSIFGFTRVRLHQNVCQLWFALNQNVFLFSCAPTSNFFPVLVFAYIENNVSLFLCASVSEGLLLLMPTFVFSLCNYSNVPLCVSFDFFISTRTISAHCHCFRWNYSGSTDKI